MVGRWEVGQSVFTNQICNLKYLIDHSIVSHTSPVASPRLRTVSLPPHISVFVFLEKAKHYDSIIGAPLLFMDLIMMYARGFVTDSKYGTPLAKRMSTLMNCAPVKILLGRSRGIDVGFPLSDLPLRPEPSLPKMASTRSTSLCDEGSLMRLPV